MYKIKNIIPYYCDACVNYISDGQSGDCSNCNVPHLHKEPVEFIEKVAKKLWDWLHDPEDNSPSLNLLFSLPEDVGCMIHKELNDLVLLYQGNTLLGLFSSKESAQKVIDTLKHKDSCRIEPVVLDEHKTINT